MNNFHKMVATGFGLGYLPKAPGTWGSIGGFLVSFVLIQLFTDPIANILHLGLAVVVYFAGVFVSRKLIPIWGEDPGKIVIDEICGIWVAYVFSPPSVNYLIAGFILFRFFDITKVLGISKIDGIKGPHSLMLDDVLAGIYSGIILYGVYFFDILPL